MYRIGSKVWPISRKEKQALNLLAIAHFVRETNLVHLLKVTFLNITILTVVAANDSDSDA